MMKPGFLSTTLIGFFVVVSVIYAMALGVNDTGFLLSVVMGVAGIALIVIWSRITHIEAGQGLIGIAVFLMTANLFGVSLF